MCFLLPLLVREKADSDMLAMLEDSEAESESTSGGPSISNSDPIGVRAVDDGLRMALGWLVLEYC